MDWTAWSEATASVACTLSSAVRTTLTPSFLRADCTTFTSGASESAPEKIATFLPLNTPRLAKAANCTGSSAALGGVNVKSGAAVFGNVPGNDPAMTGVPWSCW